MTRLTDVMDELDDREARYALAHFLAGWFEKADPGAFALAVDTWEADR